jgi:hypothetical protein
MYGQSEVRFESATALSLNSLAWVESMWPSSHAESGGLRCRDSILYRLVLAYFMAHDDWASPHNITIMCRAIPHIMRSFPAITHQTQDTFPHSHNAFPRSRLAHILVHLRVPSHIFVSHRASSHPIAHLCISLRIFTSHHASSHFTAHLRIPSHFFMFHHASSRFTTHLHISLHIFAFHHTSSRFIAHLRIPSQFSAHHRRSIHPLSSQFLGASHSIYYYIWLCLASYGYYLIMDLYFTSLTYLECSWFTSEPWEGTYVQLRVAMSVFTT